MHAFMNSLQQLEPDGYLRNATYYDKSNRKADYETTYYNTSNCKAGETTFGHLQYRVLRFRC